MSYLSQVLIGRREAINSRLHDVYAWHQAIWQAFSDCKVEERKFLFRVEVKEDNFRVFVLSKYKPDVPDWGSWQTKEITSSFLDREHYRFQLRANPTVKRVVRDESGHRKKNGRRTALYDAKELKDWLGRKAEQSGFRLNMSHLEVYPPVKQTFRKKGKSGRLSSVDFLGVLYVEDRERFRRAFCEGIGPAKGFGFGLLMLEPISV